MDANEGGDGAGGQSKACGDPVNSDSELYDPLEAASERDIARAMPGVIRRAHIDIAPRS
jgi:hypothetical protein